jgi:tRNA(Ile)-lysidine synthase
VVKEFGTYIHENNLITDGDIVLLAISGGIDSVVMMDIFHKNKVKFAIAHCNFNLRLKESDDDELLVKRLASKYKVDIHIKSCKTKKYAEENKISIQEAARELRYAWFDEISNQYNYEKVAIAHHLDDNIETFFINLSRGAGINGLKGIPVFRQNIIRPLMFAKKFDIEEYATANNLEFREDSSNEDSVYWRNNIRHNLIPQLENILPGFSNSIIKSISNLSDANQLIESVITEKTSQLFIKKANGVLKVNLNNLMTLKPLNIWIYFLLKQYGFARNTTDSICEAITDRSSTGLRFRSSMFELLIDREQLLIRKVKDTEKNIEVKIDKSSKNIAYPIRLNFKIQSKSSELKFDSDHRVAYFDLDQLQYPLNLRKWKSGDRMKPLGMNGKKLVSDMLIDNKVDSFEKDNTYVITSGDKIIWLVGIQSSEEFKVEGNTSNVLTMEYIKEDFVNC